MSFKRNRNINLRLLLILSFTLFISCGILSSDNKKEYVTDINGNRYPIITIGDQVWMAKDLRTKNYTNGEPIINGISDEYWDSLGNENIGAWAYYDNDDDGSKDYGILYNWFVITDTSGICPSQWRIPSDQDWKKLEITLGLSISEADSLDYRGIEENISNKLKISGTEYWIEPNESSTNSSGFSALPTGFRYGSSSGFSRRGIRGIWWSSTENDEYTAWSRYLDHNRRGVGRINNFSKTNGFSIRCIKEIE